MGAASLGSMDKSSLLTDAAPAADKAADGQTPAPKPEAKKMPEPIRKRKTVYALWAHYMCFFCIFLLIQQATVAFFGPYGGQPTAVIGGGFALYLAGLMFLIETISTRTRQLPLPKDANALKAMMEKETERAWPEAIQVFFTFFQNYGIRALLYLLSSIPLYISLVTVLPAVCVLICCLMLFNAYLNDEKAAAVTGLKP